MKLFNTTVTVLVAISVLATASFAGVKPAAKMAKAKTLTCPACKMPMPTKKNAMMMVPVKIKGVTYYCCDKCPAAKAHMKPAKMKAMKTAPKM